MKTKNEGKTKEELIEELEKLRRQLKKMETIETEFKRVEEELRVSEERWRSLTEDSPDHVVTIDKNLNIQFVNYASPGLTKEELIGTPIYTYAAKERQSEIKEILEKVLKTGEPAIYETAYYTPEGSTIYYESRVVPRILSGKVIGLTLHARDISRHKRAEEALQKSESKWRSLVENAPEKIITLDRDGTILFTNRAAPGRTVKQMIGTSVYNDLSPEEQEKLRQALESVFQSGRTIKYQVGVVRSNGAEIWYESSAAPIKYGKQVVAAIFIITDITELKRAENQIKTSLKDKEFLMREIHHRVKNNLSTISSLLSLQSLYIKDKRSLEVFKNSRERIQAMAIIHEKLYQSEDLHQVDLKSYIDSLTTHLFHSYLLQPGKVQLKMEIENFLLNFNTAIPIGLIINELITNSLKHAFPGTRKGKLQIHLKRSGDEKYDYTLIVKDNGVGLPESMDFQGSKSLGMKIVHALVSQLHGTIELDRKDGTTFTIKFKELQDKK